MMNFMFAPLWAALEIGFAVLFLSTFLAVRRGKDECVWIAVAAWLFTAIYGLFAVQGVHAYLMYMLSAVVLLLTVHGEYGVKGLCLLILAFLIPWMTDQAVQRLTAGLHGLTALLCLTGGKALPLTLVLVLRGCGLLPVSEAPRADGDMLLLRQHMEMQQESMAALEQNYRMQRRSTHEFEHHMQVLRGLLEQGDADAALAHLTRLQKNRSIRLTSVSANHPVVDAILNQKYQTAQENGIRMQLRVNDLSGLTLPTDALVVVLTNLLDNAIEACRRLEGCREIFCTVLADDALFISIRNTSAPVQVVDGMIPTSKQDSLSHGFGLLSVRYVLDKLNAEYTFGYDEGWFHFAAEIPCE